MSHQQFPAVIVLEQLAPITYLELTILQLEHYGSVQVAIEEQQVYFSTLHSSRP